MQRPTTCSHKQMLYDLFFPRERPDRARARAKSWDAKGCIWVYMSVILIGMSICSESEFQIAFSALHAECLPPYIHAEPTLNWDGLWKPHWIRSVFVVKLFCFFFFFT